MGGAADALALDGVWKFFGNYPALRDITLRTPAGACLALLGRNGAGKTTLLRILAGLSRAGRGSAKLLGEDARDRATRGRIGVLGHGIAVYDELTARENLRLFARLYGLANPNQSAEQWLARVGLERVGDSPVREFSRGMRQRVAVARAFLHEPQILLLDEPFTALDDRAIAVLQQVVAEARGAGRTIVMSTHQLREALDLASEVALLNHGKLVFHGPRTQAMVDDPGYLYRTHGEDA